MAIVINSREYAWGDVMAVMLGRPLSGVTAISYKTSVEKQLGRGAGAQPLSIQTGNYSYDGTITLKTSEIIALNTAAKSAGYNNLLGITTDLVVSYGDAVDMPITVDKIQQLSFTELPVDWEQGAMEATHALPFIALYIDYNITGV